MRLNAKQTDVKFVGKRKHRISNSGPVARFGVVVRDRGARMHRFKRSGLAAVKLIEDAPRFSRYASKKQIARRTMQAARLGRFPSITEISPERTTSATADLNRFSSISADVDSARSVSSIPRISKYVPPVAATPPAPKIARPSRFSETSVRFGNRNVYVTKKKIDVPLKRIGLYALLLIALVAVVYVAYWLITGDPTIS